MSQTLIFIPSVAQATPPLDSTKGRLETQRKFLDYTLKSEGTYLGSPVGELSAQLTEGFNSREKIKVKSEEKRWLCVVKH